VVFEPTKPARTYRLLRQGTVLDLLAVTLQEAGSLVDSTEEANLEDPSLYRAGSEFSHDARPEQRWTEGLEAQGGALG